ncbi:MAG: hypothetical protein OXG38_07680 [Chloroflexi bacterium]|nr:hypothetical protein [Chloroflexota bacterium]
MAASDYSAATIQTALAAAVPGLDATAAARLATVTRIAVAVEVGEDDPGEDWDPDVPAAMVVEACIRLGAYLHQSRPKLGSRLITEAAVSGASVRASGARALLMPWRTPSVTVAS